ncbi:hypothetical protein INT43_006818 [Umbelopsis isabellina]|uniref:Uncharacterized protein n=1 Tax=Mortierella isabellina TaxID=91625 RepID=A0A8H7Q0F9_MORIS|nr:hypothetical protein INT43_006818 [Umbelopsis isabellina]
MHVYPTKALLTSLLHYFALDLGQADADWLSKPAKTSHAEIVRNNKGTDLFMDDFAMDDLLRLYSQYNLLDKIRRKGYDAHFEIDVSDPFVHKISIINHSLPASEFILKAFLRRKIYQLADFKSYQRLRRESPPIQSLLHKTTSKELVHNLEQLYGSLSFSINTIEWLCLQDPAQSLTYQRPQLPGQKHPGLGLSHEILTITIQMSLKQGRDAVCALPDHFHNAILFRKKGFLYLNPAYQAIFDSLCDNLQSEIDCHGLSYVSWAVKYGYVKCRDGSSFSIVASIAYKVN